MTAESTTPAMTEYEDDADTDVAEPPDLIIGTTLEAAFTVYQQLGLDDAGTTTEVPDIAPDLEPGFSYRFIGPPTSHSGIAYTATTEVLDACEAVQA